MLLFSIPAKAIFPLAILPGVVVAFESGTLAAAYSAAIGLAGAAVWALKFPNDSGGTAVNVRINDKAPATVPTGWTAATPASADPIAPATATAGTSWSLSGNVHPSATREGVCTAFAAASGDTFLSVLGPVSGNYHCQMNENPGANYTAQLFSTVTCPAGYTASGGVCNKTNNALVVPPSDGVCEYKYNDAQQFVKNTLDPDCTGSPPNSFTQSGDLGTLTSTSANGTKTVVTAGPGSMTLEKWKPNGDGTSQYEKLIIGPKDNAAASGGTILIGGQTQRVVGEGSAAGTSTAGDHDLASARETTLAALKNNVAAGVKIDEQAASWSSVPAGLLSAQETVSGQLTGIKGGFDSAAGAGTNASALNPSLSNLVLPTSKPSALNFWDNVLPPSTSCESLSTGATGRYTGLSLDICPVVNALRGVLDWGLVCLTLLVLYSTWIGVLFPAGRNTGSTRGM